MIAKMISIPQMIIGNDDSPSTSSFKKCIYKKKSPVAQECNNNAKPQHLEQDEQDGVVPSGIQVRRTVTFSKRVQAKKVRKLDKYTKEEKDVIWYTTEEYASIKNRCIQTLKLMSAAADGNFEDCDEYSSRGLECRLKAASKCRKETRAFALNAVFEEQGRQALEDDVDAADAELIREVYLSVAASSQQLAHFQGIRDRAAVDAMLDEE